jgi:signal transduction histidine kinase
VSRRRGASALGLGRDLVLAVAACAIAVLAALSIQLYMTEYQMRETSLAEAAHYVERHLRILPERGLHLPIPPGSSWASFGYPTVVFGPGGQVLYKRPNGLDPAVIAALAPQRLPAAGGQRGAVRIFRLALGEERIIGAALAARSGGRVIVVFKDENAPDVLVDDVVREFPYRSIAVLVPVFAGLLVGGWWIVRRRTRPIARASAIARTIGPDTLALRLPEEDLPPEVLPIVQAVNGAFARLERGAEAQREFLDRAAHQLRTPLTLLSARASLLADREAAAALQGDVRELARIVSQLLQLNELDALPDGGEALADLGAVGEAVRAELADRAAGRGQRLALVRPDAPVLVRGDPNVIEVAVRNLAENALRHSPEGGPVTIRVAADGELAVEDCGPGVPAALREKIFEPFWSDNPNGGCAGLGLTIVRRIAERCGAAVTVADAPAGGARFALRFAPAASAGLRRDPAALAAAIPASLALRRRRAALDRLAG